MWFDCVERKRRAKLPLSTTAPRAFAAAPSFQACWRAFICTFYMCVYICVCVYVCGHVYMYVYACVYVFGHLCVYTHVYVYVYAYLCIDCGSWYQCFSVWTVSCMRMCFLVHMYVCVYVCVWVHIYVHFFAVSVTCTLLLFWALVHGQMCMLHRCVFTPTYTSANTLAAGCAHMCIVYICVYTCICIWMRMCVYDIA